MQSRSSAVPASSPPTRWRGYLAVGFAASLWGTWSLFFRPVESIAKVESSVQSFVVMATVLFCLLPFAIRDRVLASTSIAKGAWLLMVAIGVIDALNVLFFFRAMQHATLAVAVLTHYLALPLVAITAPIIVRERTSAKAWFALCIALIGLALLLEPWKEASQNSLKGAMFGSISALFFTANVLMSKRASRFFPTRDLLVWRLPVALCVLFLAVPKGGFNLPFEVYALLFAAGLLGGVVAGQLYYYGLGRVEAERVTLISLIEPVVAVLIGILVWSEIPGPFAALGAILILFALYQTTRAS